MAEENKGTPEPTEEVVVTTEPKDDEPTEETKVESEESKQLEAQLQEEKDARKKAEKKLADNAFKEREKTRVEEPEPVAEEDKPVTRKELHEFMTSSRKNEIDGIVAGMSEDDKERELIILTHKNRSFPSNLPLEKQLEECYLIANKSKIFGENKELKRALKGKKGVNSDGSPTHQDAPEPGSMPKLASGDKAEYTRAGFTWNSQNKLYEKKLSNGSTLTKNPKTGETKVV